MIQFKPSGVSLGEVDLMQMFALIFQILIDKRVMTENELAGYLIKAGFPVIKNEAGRTPGVERHDQGCTCRTCLMLQGLQ